MGSASAIKAGGAVVELFTDWSRMKAGLNAAEQFSKQWGSKMRSAGTSILGSGPASFVSNYLANATGASAGLGLLATSFANAGSELVDMASRTGASTESLSALKFAAGQTGTDFGQLEGGIRKFSKNLSDANAGEQEAAASFAKWGLATKQFQGLGIEDQLALIANRMQSLSAADRTAMSMDLFGKSGTALIPILGGGAAAMQAMTDRARELGIVWSDDAAQKADIMGDRLDEMKLVGISVAYALGEQLYPVVMGLSDVFFDAANGVKEWIADNPRLASGLAVVMGGAAVAGVAFAGLGVALGGLATTLSVVGPVLSAIALPAALVGAGVLIETQTGIGAAAIDYLAETMRELGTTGNVVVDGISAGFSRVSADASMLASSATSAWGGIVDAVSAGDLGLAGEIAMAGLNVAWQIGLAEIKDLWTISMAWLETEWVGFTTFFQEMWANASVIVQKVWNQVVGWFDGVMTEMSTIVVDAQRMVGLMSDAEARQQRGMLRADRDRRAEARDAKVGEWDDTAQKEKAARISKIQEEREKSLQEHRQQVLEARQDLEGKVEKSAKQLEEKIGERNNAMKAVAQAEEDGPNKKHKTGGGIDAGNITVSGLAASMTRAFGWMAEMKPEAGPKPGRSMLPLAANDPKNAAAQNAREMEKLRQYEQGLQSAQSPAVDHVETAANTMTGELLGEIASVLHSIDSRVASGGQMGA